MLLANADRFGFDWPPDEENPGAHIQAVRATSVRWKGRTYRYVTVRTATDSIDVRVAPGGSIRVTRDGRELIDREGS